MSQIAPIENIRLFAAVQDCINEGLTTQFKVRGTSMRPFLRDNRDMVLFAPFEDSELKKGAVILFRHKGGYIMHRISQRTDDELIIRGDGVLKNREFAKTSDVVAIVKQIIRIKKNGEREIIPCDSRRWKIYSFLWLSLPRFCRRTILHFL